MTRLRLRRLEAHRVDGTRDQMQLAYQTPHSPSGKVYHYSPNPAAIPRLFLIGNAPTGRIITPENQTRIRREPGPGQTVCPYSGYMAPDEEFVHSEDIEAIEKQIGWEFGADVEDYLTDMAKDFNRRQPRNSFVNIKMDFKLSHRPRPVAIRTDLLRDLECGVCGRAYAVYAIALFCPDCGAPNLALHFKREIDLVSQQIALADSQNAADEPELAYRLMGNAHEDVLSAFETALKTVYRYLVRERIPDDAASLCSKQETGNAFQNIKRVHDKFARFDLDPFAELSREDVDFLRTNVQKRHVIGHNLGMADEHYRELVQTEQPGETVSVIGNEIHRFARICLHVVIRLESRLEPLRQRPSIIS